MRALREGRDVVVHAPTGAGKTFIFDLFVQELRGQTVFTVPTRALANDKLAEWRALTALSLHGDLSHVAANIASGLLFSAFALPHFGTGLTWLLIVFSGFFGNVLNAFFYRSSPHNSIGSSTAVFGALGLLVAAEFVARLSSPARRNRWQLVLPIGAGLALLAYLGVGDTEHNHTDYMAHLLGFGAGISLGAIAALAHARDRLSLGLQHAAAAIAPLLIIAAWWLALAHLR